MKYPSSQHTGNLRRSVAFYAAWLCGVVIATHNVFAQSDSEIADQAFAMLGLVDGQVVDVLPVATATGGLQVVVPVNGTPETIVLTSVSVRSPGYTVLVQKDDGTLEQAEPTTEHSYRGSIIGMAESVVAATYDETGFRGKILLADGTRLWVEPLAGKVAAASSEQHIVYRDEDMQANPDSCPEPIRAHDHEEPEPNAGAVAGSPGLYVAELAIDADYEYFLAYTSVAAVENQVNTVINAMNVQYEGEVQIRHVISAIIVRKSEPDPYTATDSSALLNQFRNRWENNHTSVQRDVAQLFTGKDIDSNVIGIAFGGEICTTSAYGVVQSDYNGSSLAYQTDLSAHELGHNWNAQHCSCTNPPYTMNPSITGANRFHPTLSIPDIVAYRNTRGCLDVGDELLGISINIPSTTFEVGQAAELTATAIFLFGPNQNVPATWTVDRPEFANISSNGLLVLLASDAESCVTINASYTSDGITKTDQQQITVKDPAKAMEVLSSNPPVNAIDARRPTDLNGNNRTGWTTFDLALNSEPCSLSPNRFGVIQEGGSQAPPIVSSVTMLGGNMVRLTLDKAIDSGAWTTIYDSLSYVSLRVGFLPGDVNGDRTATPADILTLIDSLNGVSTLPMWSTDMDRSGVPLPADILTIIDLLNGAGAYAAWNGVSLPEN